MKTFKDLNLSAKIQEVLDGLGFTNPTEIQEKAIPMLSSEKIDFHGQAQTGTGKTLAFGIPLIQSIDSSKRKVQALIVAPTRELVLQICDSLQPFAKATGISVCPIYGGVSIVKQLNDLKRGVHIVVGTPGRLNDHLNRKTLSLSELRVLVLDEADIMLDMGFKEEIDEILTYAPENRSIWLFSATIKPGINDIKNSHMKNVATVRVSPNKTATQNTTQYYCVAPMGTRLNALASIVDSDPEFYGFIFCPTKMLTAEVSEKLSQNGYNVNCLHGDMNQSARTKVIQQFREKKFTILVATDVAARGIDIPDITHVINYALPNDHENYVHRVGRTGRAGKTGIAITLVSNSEVRRLKSLGFKFNVEIKPMNIPQTQDLIQVQLKRMQDFISKLSEKSITTSKFEKELENTLSTFKPEQNKNILANLLAEKFFKKFENAQEDSVCKYKKELDKNNLTELKIDLGSMHGITERDIKRYLAENGKVLPNELSKVKVLREKSFIALSSKRANDLIPMLQNARLNGRRARVNFAY